MNVLASDGRPILISKTTFLEFQMCCGPVSRHSQSVVIGGAAVVILASKLETSSSTFPGFPWCNPACRAESSRDGIEGAPPRGGASSNSSAAG
jgi:hypothetical protein